MVARIPAADHDLTRRSHRARGGLDARPRDEAGRRRSRRLVARRRSKDHDDDWYLQVSAPIATTGSLDPLGLLEWNGRSAAGALMVAEGTLFYRRVYPLEWLDLGRIDTALSDVARTSATVEMMLAEHGVV